MRQQQKAGVRALSSQIWDLKRFGSRTALIADSGATMTYEQLAQAGERIAGSAGAKPGRTRRSHFAKGGTVMFGSDYYREYNASGYKRTPSILDHEAERSWRSRCSSGGSHKAPSILDHEADREYYRKTGKRAPGGLFGWWL